VLLSQSGCKSSGFTNTNQMFLAKSFRQNTTKIHKRLKTKNLEGKIFLRKWEKVIRQSSNELPIIKKNTDKTIQ
jgi:hypothetical protein